MVIFTGLSHTYNRFRVSYHLNYVKIHFDLYRNNYTKSIISRLFEYIVNYLFLKDL